jgi:predicted Zn-dependent protease
MMLRRSMGVLAFILLFIPALSFAQDEVDAALRDLPPALRTEYRRQLLQLDRVARRIRQAIPNAPQVNFTLAAGEPSINAGTTFGRIIVSEGMMRFVHSDDELAMILGHEYAHQTQGHVTRGAISNTLLGIGSIIAGSLMPGAGQATNLVGQLFLNRFNQEQEREADRVGLQYVADAGYDTQRAIQVMRRMAEEVPESAAGGFFSSHPSSVDRFDLLQRQAAQLSSSRPTRYAAGEREGSRLLAQRDEQACRQAQPLFHRAKDTSDVDRKIALYQRGLKICPESPRAHAELARTYATLGEHREAIEEYREALRYDPDYPGARDRLLELENRAAR